MTSDELIYGYGELLEAAGATVLAFLETGKYHGRWVALVKVGDRTGWVVESFGSCVGCDDLQKALYGGGDDLLPKLIDEYRGIVNGPLLSVEDAVSKVVGPLPAFTSEEDHELVAFIKKEQP